MTPFFLAMYASKSKVRIQLDHKIRKLLLSVFYVGQKEDQVVDDQV